MLIKNHKRIASNTLQKVAKKDEYNSDTAEIPSFLCAIKLQLSRRVK